MRRVTLKAFGRRKVKLGSNRSARQRKAKEMLGDLFGHPESVAVIHYSCESFYDRPDGRSARITSIAARKLDSGQTTSFSIHQIAERLHLDPFTITENYDCLERRMLAEFSTYAQQHQDMKYLHWNMRDINFGFQALAHRASVYGIEMYDIPEPRRYDLSRMMIDIYGVGYIGHPRLQNLLKANDIKPLDFLSGGEEARAFDEKKYVALHQSTLRKVDILANLAARAHDGTLRTNATWWVARQSRHTNISSHKRSGQSPIATACPPRECHAWEPVSTLGFPMPSSAPHA